MTSNSGSPYDLSRILSAAGLAKMAFIGAIVGAFAVAFAWAGGLFSPHRLDQARMIDTFEAVNGPHPGFRRNHAKGVCLTGYFDGNGAGVRYSTAQVFRQGRIPVFGRFALAGGMPRTPDSPAAVRSLAVNFALPDGELWRTAMIDIPVFPMQNPQAFNDQLVATAPDPRTGKPDPDKVKQFLAAYPETARALALVGAQPFSSGFANATYNGLNTFLLTDAAGHQTAVRWSVVPEDAFVPETTQGRSDTNYLFDDLIARMGRGPVRWHLILVLGQPADPTNDPTLPWPADRPRIDAGTLTVTALQTEAPGNCRDINFDPLILPAGISPSHDPILSARSAAYSVSFTRRAGEPKSPSAVQVTKGP